MGDRTDPRNRSQGTEAARARSQSTDRDPSGWEAKVLARVRPHVRELSGPGAAQAGWETDTITRLEDYFDRGEV